MTEPTSVILGSIVTEKSERMKTVDRQYSFRVSRVVNKIEIRQAVEKLFKVHVTEVRVMNYMGKMRRMGRFQGRKPDWKKAIVTLKKGETIESLER
jgi:large subunit ribosomal protein L23